MSQEFSRQIQKIAKDLTTILNKLRAKTDNLAQAKIDQKVRKEEWKCVRGATEWMPYILELVYSGDIDREEKIKSFLDEQASLKPDSKSRQ